MVVDADVDELDSGVDLHVIVDAGHDLGGHLNWHKLRESLAKSGFDLSSVFGDQGSTSGIDGSWGAAATAQRLWLGLTVVVTSMSVVVSSMSGGTLIVPSIERSEGVEVTLDIAKLTAA